MDAHTELRILRSQEAALVADQSSKPMNEESVDALAKVTERLKQLDAGSPKPVPFA